MVSSFLCLLWVTNVIFRVPSIATHECGVKLEYSFTSNYQNIDEQGFLKATIIENNKCGNMLC